MPLRMLLTGTSFTARAELAIDITAGLLSQGSLDARWARYKTLKGILMQWEQHISAGQSAFSRGFYKEAEGHYLRALEVAAKFGTDDPCVADTHRGLARTYLELNKNAEAEASARLALQSDETYWGADCERAAESQFLLGEALRRQGDFERAKPAYEKSLAVRSQMYGDAHDETLHSLVGMVLVYLESAQDYGFEQLHARTFHAFQAVHPVGTWANFLRLSELGAAYAAEGKLSDYQQIMRRAVSALKKHAGANHREVASLLACESETLKQGKQQMAAWHVKTQATHIKKTNHEDLVFAEERAADLDAHLTFSIVERLLRTRGSLSSNAPPVLHRFWWQVKSVDVAAGEIAAELNYLEDSSEWSVARGGILAAADPHACKLKLAVRCVPRATQTSLRFHWQVENSSRQQVAKDVVMFMVEELMSTLTIVPRGDRSMSAAGSPAFESQEPHWPTAQQINEAIQNPRFSLHDEQLKVSEPELNQIGLPKPLSGAFATVYNLTGPAGHWAVKCFTQPVAPEHHFRYRAIDQKLNSVKLPYFIKFAYDQQGLKIGQDYFPLLKMDWAAGQALNTYVAANLHNAKCLTTLSSKFMAMVEQLRAAGIAHGDLQHGNILVQENGGLILVDYDGMYLPELEKLGASELGHRNYQHPKRGPQHYGLFLDNFSSWTIYVSLVCISRDPLLWDSLLGGDECLLFRQLDFVDPKQSRAFQVLLNHADAEIRNAAGFLARLTTLEPEAAPTFTSVFGGQPTV